MWSGSWVANFVLSPSTIGRSRRRIRLWHDGHRLCWASASTNRHAGQRNVSTGTPAYETASFRSIALSGTKPTLPERPGLTLHLRGDRGVEVGLPRRLAERRDGGRAQLAGNRSRAGGELDGPIDELVVGIARPREADLRRPCAVEAGAAQHPPGR